MLRPVLIAATLLYATSCLLGLVALWGRRRLGRAHHVAYALCCLGTAAATMFDFRWGLLVVLAVLAGFPWARPRSGAHIGLAALGGLALVVTWWS